MKVRLRCGKRAGNAGEQYRCGGELTIQLGGALGDIDASHREWADSQLAEFYSNHSHEECDCEDDDAPQETNLTSRMYAGDGEPEDEEEVNSGLLTQGPHMKVV